MKISNDGFQVKMTEIPEIIDENLVNFLFKVCQSMPLWPVGQSKKAAQIRAAYSLSVLVPENQVFFCRKGALTSWRKPRISLCDCHTPVSWQGIPFSSKKDRTMG